MQELNLRYFLDKTRMAAEVVRLRLMSLNITRSKIWNFHVEEKTDFKSGNE